MRQLCRLMCVSLGLFFLLVAGQAQAFQQSGYKVTYCDVWPDGAAVRYIKVTITPLAGKSLDDIDFFAVASGYNYGSTVRCYNRIRLNRGDASASGELYLVDGQANVSLHVETDGNLKRDRWDMAKEDSSQRFWGADTWQMPSMLFANDQIQKDQLYVHNVLAGPSSGQARAQSLAVSKTFVLDDISESMNATGVAAATGKVILAGVNHSRVSGMTLESLPSHWYAYQGLGLLVLDAGDLGTLESKYPKKLNAIRRWVAHSGVVILTHCGSDLEGNKAPDALEYFGPQCKSRFEEGKVYIPTATLMARSLSIGGTVARNRQPDVHFEKRGGGSKAFKLKGKKVQADNLMVALPFVNGRIICLSDEASTWDSKATGGPDYFTRVGNFANALLEDTGFVQLEGYASWNYSRTYLPHYASEFGFPEFSKPPRFVFESVSIIYLILIGPVAWLVLKRKNRLNLMYVIVPILSALFCLAILGYAIFSEGFDKRVNRISVTHLDQNHKRQTTQALFHVYSGVQPGPYRFSGTNFGVQTAFGYGTRSGVKFDYGLDTPQRTETLAGGDISSRTNHQITVYDSSETERGLDVRFPKDGSAPTVVNRLETGIQIALISANRTKSSATDCWMVKDLAAGARTKAEKVKLSEAQKQVRELAKEHLAPTSWDRPGFTRSNPSATYYNGSTGKDVSSVLSDIRFVVRKKLQENDVSVERGYFAFVEETDFTPTPIQDASVMMNLNIIVGRLPR